MPVDTSIPFHPRLVGVVHLEALPGTARGGAAADLPRVLDRARRDALVYAEEGMDAIIVENFGDLPFVRNRVPAQTVAAMTLAADAVHRTAGLPIGVNVLRNDVLSAVAISAMTGGRFVRANVYTGAAVTDQGLIQPEAEAVQALIGRLGANVEVWADIDVKHAAPLAPRPLAEVAADAIERGLAAAVIVTGRSTGEPVPVEDIEEVRYGVGGHRVIAGSGVTPENVAHILAIADGVIVGTSLKQDGVVTHPVDRLRVRALVAAAS